MDTVKIIKVVLFVSIITSIFITTTALLSSQAMIRELSSAGLNYWVVMVLSIPPISGFLWFLLLPGVSENANESRALAFSFSTFLISLIFYQPISTAPAEGVGYNLIFCVALIGVSCLLLLPSSSGNK